MHFDRRDAPVELAQVDPSPHCQLREQIGRLFFCTAAMVFRRAS